MCKYSARIGQLQPMAEPISRFRARKPIARDGTEQSGREAARRSRRRSCRCNSNPIRCRFSARIDNATGETVSSTRTNTVKATLFEVVYCGFNRRMLLTSEFEVLNFLSFPFTSVQFSFSWQGIKIQNFIKSVGRTVKPALQARSSGYFFCASRIIETAISPPSHNILWSRMN